MSGHLVWLFTEQPEKLPLPDAQRPVGLVVHQSDRTIRS